MARSSRHGFECDAVAEAMELEQCAAATVFGVVAGELVTTEIVVAGVGGQDVPGGDEQAVGDGGLSTFAAQRTATRRNRAWAVSTVTHWFSE